MQTRHSEAKSVNLIRGKRTSASGRHSICELCQNGNQKYKTSVTWQVSIKTFDIYKDLKRSMPTWITAYINVYMCIYMHIYAFVQC